MKTNQLTRRAALGAIAVTPLATLPSNAKPHDPIPQWFEQWKASREELNQSADDTAEERGAWAEFDRLAILISTTQATTAEGIAAQLEWFEIDMGEIIQDFMNDESKVILSTLLVGVRGLA